MAQANSASILRSFHATKHIAVIAMALGSVVMFAPRAVRAVTVDWRDPESQSGNWDGGGNGCNASGSYNSQWWYSGWGGDSSRNRADCYGNHQILFNNNRYTTMSINGSWHNANTIEFASGASTARTISDNGVNLYDSGAKIVNNSTATHVFNSAINLGIAIEVGTASGDLTFNGTVSGDYNLTKTGTYTLKLTGQNTFGLNSVLYIDAGTLELAPSSGTDPLDVKYIKLGYQTGDVTLKLSGSQNFTLNSDNSGDIQVRSTSGTKKIQNVSGNNTISAPIVIGDTGQTVTLYTTVDSGNLTISSIISQGGTSGLLTKDGTATLTLGGANTYGGATTVSAGTLQLGASNVIPDASAVSVSSGAVLDLNGKTESFTSTGLTINGTGISSGGALINSSATAATLSSTVNNSTTVLTLGADSSVGGSGTITISGLIAGSAKTLTKVGSGLLVLNNGTANSYSNVVLNAGTLSIWEGNSLGALPGSPVTNLQFTGNSTLRVDHTPGSAVAANRLIAINAGVVAQMDSQSYSFELAGVISGAGSIKKIGNGTLKLSGANTYTGGVDLNAGTLGVYEGTSMGPVAGSQLTFSGNSTLQFQKSPANPYNANRLFTINPGVTATFDTQNYNANILGVISGSGALTKIGAGILTLSGANSYGGDTTISAGTILLGTGGNIPDGSSKGNVVFNPSSGTATLDLWGNTETINGLSSSGAGSSVVDNSSGTGSLTVGANDQTSSFGGVIQNSGGSLVLTKTGSGVLTLTGANTYGGNTTISAGTLKLDAGGSMANTPNITIASGATLDVSTPTTALSLGSGQALKTGATGGNTTATVNTGSGKNLTLSAGGLFFTALGSANTTAPFTVSGSGALALNSAPVTVTTSTQLGVGSYKLVAKSGSASVTGTPGTLTVGGSSTVGTAKLRVTSGELYLDVCNTTVTTTSLPNATQNSAYSQTLAASGGTGPYTLALASGSLPAGLSLNTSTGEISGTPTTPGVSSFSVTATDSSAAGCVSAAQPLSITVACGVTITLSPGGGNPQVLTAGTVGTAYSQTITASGGSSPYTYNVSSGSLPGGLTLSSGGSLSGTPTASGTFTFTVTATDNNGCPGSQNYSLTISCPTITVSPASLNAGAVGTAYSQTISASGGTSPYSFSVTSGSLPAGLTLSSGGSLSGTPTSSGVYNFTVTATDNVGCTQAKAYTLTINIDIVVFGTSLGKGQGSSGYSNGVVVAGSWTNGWAHLLTTNMANRAPSLVVTNSSVPGNSSSQGVTRFPTDVVPLAPRYVLISYSLGNDNLSGASDPAAVVSTFSSNLSNIIAQCRSSGFYPVTGLSYARNGIRDAGRYSYVKAINLAINTWNIPSVNVDGAMDDGNGGLITAIDSGDAIHPNDYGFQEMYYTIVPRLFDAVAAGKTNSPTSGSVTNFARLTYNAGVTAPVTFTPSDTVHSFTMSFRVRSTVTGTVAAVRSGSNYGTLEVRTNQLVYISSGGQEIAASVVATNGAWYDVALACRYAQSKTYLYVDGALAGTLTEQYAPDQFILGGPSGSGRAPTPATVDLQNWCVYRSAWNEDEAAAQVQGNLQQSSMEIFSRLDEASYSNGSATTNRAQSLSVVMVNTANLSPSYGLPAPTNLTVQRGTGRSAQLNWSWSGSGQTGFVIQRRVSVTGTWSDVGSVGAGTTTYTDPGLTWGVVYDYRVAALESGGLRNSYSNTATILVDDGSHPTILIDLGPNDVTNGDSTTSPDYLGQYWNNLIGTAGGSANSVSLGNLVTRTNESTTIGLFTGSTGWSCNGKLNGGLLAPSFALLGNFAVTNATEDYFHTGSSATLTITNLDATANYRLRYFGTRDTTETRTTRYVATGGNGVFTNTLTTSGTGIGYSGGNFNNNTIASVSGVTPNGSNKQIQLDVSIVTGSFGYLGILEIMANHAPAANNDSFSRTAGTSITLTNTQLTANDGDSDGDAFSFVGFSSLPAGATTNATTITLPASCATESFSYTITDEFGGSSNGTVTVTATGGAPSITGQPGATNVCSGASASFTVTATGSPNYAWRKRGAGWGTGNAWSLSAGGGGFFVGSSVNNGGASSGGIDTGGQAWGMYNSSGGTAVATRNFTALSVGQTFQIDMDNGYINTGKTVGFGLQNSSGENVWEFYFTGGGSSYIINAGSVSPTPSIGYTANGLRITFTLTSSTTYSVSVQGLNGGSSYGPYTGTLLNPSGGQSITKFRGYNSDAGSGEDYDLFFNNLVAGNFGDDAAAYTSWANNDNKGQGPLAASSPYSNVATATLTINPSTSGEAGDYDVVIYNTCGQATSSSAALTVTASTTPSVSIAANPGTSICAGTSVTFTATPTNGGTSPSYQWKKNGGSVGSNSSTYIDSSWTNGDTIQVVMTPSTDACPSSPTANSNTLTMTVGSTTTPSVSISANPGTTICSGTSVTFTATPTNGGASPSYQWKKNGGNVGSNSSTYIDSSLSNNDQISVVMTPSVDACASPATADSNTLTMTVTSAPSAPTAGSSPSTVYAGDTLSLTASTISGATYTWSGPNGFTSSQQNPTISNVTTNGTGTYSVTATVGGCTSPAGTVAVTVNKLLWPGAGYASDPASNIHHYKEQAVIGNGYILCMLDANGTLYDIHFPSVGVRQGSGTANEGYKGPEEFIGSPFGCPGLDNQANGQMNVIAGMGGIGITDSGTNSIYWLKNQVGTHYTDVGQQWAADDTLSVLTSNRLTASGYNIKVIQHDFVPVKSALPVVSDGVRTNYGVYVKRFQLINQEASAKTIDFYYDVNFNVKGANADDVMSFDDTRRAMIVKDTQARYINGTGCGPNGYGGSASTEYKMASYSGDYLKSNSVYFATVMKLVTNTVSGAGIGADGSWRDHSPTDNQEGWIGKRITIPAGETNEVEVMIVGSWDDQSGMTGTHDYWGAPLIDWFYTNNMATAQQTTDNYWSNWIASGVTIDFPGDYYDRMFKRQLLISVIHQDAVTGTVQILVLPGLQRPPEQCSDDEDQHQRQGDQKIKNVHSGHYPRCRRNALSTTSRELADMPIPAIQGVTQPAMASGMARKL